MLNDVTTAAVVVGSESRSLAKTLSIGSLFSGVGGLDLAVEAVTGGQVAWMCERDAYCRRVLARHWPAAPIFDDVEGLRPPPADILCGGFPCQDISKNNPHGKERKGIEGEKSGLWFEFARLIRDLRPRLIFLENVAAIRTAGMDAVLGSLAALRYDAEWACFRASDVGAPHRRDRWFCIAWVAHTSADRPQKPSDAVSGRKALAADLHRGRDACRQSRTHLMAHHWPPRPNDLDGWRQWLGGDLCSPVTRRSADGPRQWVDVCDRLRVLGNAVCPQQAVAAYEELLRRGKLL